MEDLRKDLHIKRPEQKVAILELIFYQKLSKSNFHENYQEIICKWKSSTSKILITNNSFYFPFPSSTAVSIERRLLVLNKLISLLSGMHRLIHQHPILHPSKNTIITENLKHFEQRHPHSQNNENNIGFNSEFPHG